MLARPGLVGHALAFLEIGAGAKGPLPRPGEDDAAAIAAVEVETLEQRHDVGAALRIHRVGDVGAIERDEHDMLARPVDAQRGKGHGGDLALA